MNKQTIFSVAGEVVFATAIFVVLYLENAVWTLFKYSPLPYLLEGIVHIVTTRLSWVPNAIRSVFGMEIPPLTIKPKPIPQKLLNCGNMDELCRYWGYPLQTHCSITQDGYILTLHRISGRNIQGKSATETGDVPKPDHDLESIMSEHPMLLEPAGKKPVVLLWHGFMQSSEIWVCQPEAPKTSLAFLLADLGYDVFLGNTRGNKYSAKHISKSRDSSEFWDFSLDEVVAMDFPATVDTILKLTQSRKLSIIGFSQATAQILASMAVQPQLTSKVSVVVALAPLAELSPSNLPSKIMRMMMKTTPGLLYMVMGRRRAIPSVGYWSGVLPKQVFVALMDAATNYLFGWKGSMIPPGDKAMLYPHLYSYTSVKSVVHWLQIIQSGTFQMFDEGSGEHIVPKFPMGNLHVPVAILHGGQDSLTDVNFLMKNLHRPPILHLQVEEYEHLDFLWATGVNKVVNPAIIGVLETYARKSRSWEEAVDAVVDPWDVEMVMQAGQVRREDGKMIMGGSISVWHMLKEAEKRQRLMPPGSPRKSVRSWQDQSSSASKSSPKKKPSPVKEVKEPVLRVVETIPVKPVITTIPVATPTNFLPPLPEQNPKVINKNFFSSLKDKWMGEESDSEDDVSVASDRETYLIAG